MLQKTNLLFISYVDISEKESCLHVKHNIHTVSLEAWMPPANRNTNKSWDTVEKNETESIMYPAENT